MGNCLNVLKRIHNLYLRRKDIASRGTICRSSPIYVQIEPTIRCNLSCTFCNDDIKKRSSKRDMTFLEFQNIFDQFPYLHSINITGYGEPLLNPEIYTMIEYAKSKGVMVFFATNCTLLDAERSARVLESGLDCIIFSIDALTPELYNKVRRGAKLETVIANIKTFMQLVRDQESPIAVKIYAVETRDNLEELPKIVAFAAEVGIGSIRFQSMFDHTGSGQKSVNSALWSSHNIIGDIRRIRQLAQSLADENAIELETFPLVPSNEPSCTMPWSTCYITVEGYVTPCCVQGIDPRVIHFGNLYESSFETIWNNALYQDFRRRMESDDPPWICRSCPRYRGLL